MTNNDKIPELTNGEFEKFTKEGFTFISFHAEWHMPSVMMGPIIEDLSEEFGDKIKFGKVEVEDNSELAEKFGVNTIPSFMLFRDGIILEQVVGSLTQEELGNILREYINQGKQNGQA
ncbi:thiol reductase thioredoxin [Candidatus Pacearchaeota archaeon ex4484_71]|nr:MAG: thiol reductase thioredoxin [Candidatus Pacearchaeota archaeon ex4484_71]